jgi:hypothetical protein
LRRSLSAGLLLSELAYSGTEFSIARTFSYEAVILLFEVYKYARSGGSLSLALGYFVYLPGGHYGIE